jgi:putative DNA primase/helicase
VKEHKTGKAPDAAHVNAWLKTAQAAGTLRAIVGLTKGIAGITTDVADFDAHPDLLNTQTGVVDLRTGELLSYAPELLMTKIAGASYVAGAAHHDWNAALEAIPADCRAYAQLRYGQAITGHMTPDDTLLVQEGGGENGKSTVMNAIAAAIGDYFTHVSERVLLANPGDHPTEFMDLRGARLALIEETPEVHRLSVTRLKKVVGTPRITARRIRQDPVTFTATHSLVVSTNYTPSVDETDHGTWRRLILLRFPYRFRKKHEPLEHDTDRRSDPGLRERLAHDDAAAAAVLAWLVDGAVTWYALKRTMPEPPARVVADTRTWRHEADHIMAYVDERLIPDPATHVMAAELLADFNDWLRSRGQYGWSDKLFALRFVGHDALAGRVTKKKARPNDRLSRRPPVAGWASPGLPVPSSYQAWFGVRFRTESDEIDGPLETPKSRVVPAVPGASVNPASDPLVRVTV